PIGNLYDLPTTLGVASDTVAVGSWTPLLAAARYGHHDAVWYLLDLAGQSADETTAPAGEWTPLQLAALGDSVATVDLLEARADAEDCWEALDWAAWAGRAAAFRVLLDKLRARRPEDWLDRVSSVVQSAAVGGDRGIVEQLLDEIAGRPLDTPRGRMLLAVAARAGHLDVVRCFLERGADPLHRDDRSWSALHKAAAEGHAAVVATLLDRIPPGHSLRTGAGDQDPP
ncbi:ankyrin repeat domain-containing protein 50-like, partial [Frankliniella occidentalis]|uniref:Ankyrin repeat domain-containing protein 50-like n=1 Tax=Frankliniella occidentalis TaxID=133901 RepID=A0A6J1TNX3_FRAOC